MPKVFRFILIYLTIVVLSVSLTKIVLAFPSSSTNYKLDAELGIFGGEKSSTNYRLTDTGGGFATGFSDSSNYRSCSGFQCLIAQVPTITFTLSTNTINLGTLTTGGVNTSSHTISVTTNLGGYTTKVYEDGNLCRIVLPCNSANDIADVADGAVTANNEEYGMATSQAGNDITQDTSCGSAAYNASGLTTGPQSVASKASPTVSAETTTICYAAAITGATAAGNYKQIVTYITTGTF